MNISIAIPGANSPSENRISLVPNLIAKYESSGAKLLIEQGAGLGSHIADEAWSGAEIVADRATLMQRADIVYTVDPPTQEFITQLKDQTVLIGNIDPHNNTERFELLKSKRITCFAVELIPRISRAQSMDVLSSQAAIAGYKATLIAANTASRFFPMLTTAAGTIRPAKVLVVGAGVAGLQAIATARRLGAMTEGYDVRPETKEQVESLGAKFLELGVSAIGEGGYARALNDAERAEQQQQLSDHLKGVDILITTAAIPGRKAPTIVTQSMVEVMKPGSVIVDIAAEGGGNCELTVADKTIVHQGVSIVGPVNLASQMPMDASQMYAKNLWNFISPFLKDGELQLNWDDEILQGSVITHDGEIRYSSTT